MSDHIFIDGIQYVPVSAAAELTALPEKDVGYLCESGVARARRMGGRWYVDIVSLREAYAAAESQVAREEKKKEYTDIPEPPARNISEKQLNARAVTSVVRSPPTESSSSLKRAESGRTRGVFAHAVGVLLIVAVIFALEWEILGASSPSYVRGAQAAAVSAADLSFPEWLLSRLFGWWGSEEPAQEQFPPIPSYREVRETLGGATVPQTSRAPTYQYPTTTSSTSTPVTLAPAYVPPKPQSAPAPVISARTSNTVQPGGQTIINNPVVERIIERPVYVSGGNFVSADTLAYLLAQTEYSLRQDITRIAGRSVGDSIDNLDLGISLSDLTDANIPNDITASNYLPLAGGTLTGVISNSASATSTFTGGFSAAALNITSTSASSTFANGINLSGGCFAVNGTCLESRSGIVGSGTTGQFPYYAADGTTLSATSSISLATSGNVGIGTSTPYSKLTVWGGGTGVGQAFEVVNSASTTLAKILDNGTAYFLGNLGVGTTTPSRKLSVTDTVSAAQVAIAYDATRYTELQTDSVGDFVVNPSGDDAFLNDDNLWVCTGGSCPAGVPTGTGNLIVENKVGIGTTTPRRPLHIEDANPTILFYDTDAAMSSSRPAWFSGQSGANYVVGTTSDFSLFGNVISIVPNISGAVSTSTFTGDIKITGKLDVGTIDPVYTIDGTKYATYGHSTIGIKEEVLATIEFTKRDAATGKYVHEISFGDVPVASDIWLFYQITDFGTDWKNLVVSLTPSFDGNVYYKKVPEERKLLLMADMAGEASMRLVANRYDSAKWPNLRPDQEDTSYLGHVIESK